ncbi:MAG: hypothetical protein DSY47_07945 [Hydrogenothermus sp.]|nr:MAG: hypothetical protein DSY47_07945 [Hydrogenothermus sp.]
MGRLNPTIDELKTFAELADKAYQDWIPESDDKNDSNNNKSTIPIGDKTFTVKKVLNDTETGTYAFLAEDEQGNKYIVFRGTEEKGDIKYLLNDKDLANDIDILMGKTPEQLKVAQDWINNLKDNGLISESDNVYAVGHSLGGYLAN